MNNLFNNFMVNVLNMAHEDPPTGNGGNNNSGTGTNTGTNSGGNNGTTDPEDLNSNTNPEGGNSGNTSGGGTDEIGRPIPDVGIGGL